MLFSPLDPLLAVLYTAYKVRALRGLVLFVGLIPASLYALPAQSCGCLRTPFVRCKPSGNPYAARMKSDLKNLASQQEIYLADHGSYSADPVAMSYVTSAGVDVSVVASADGWAARATHGALPKGQACALRYGAEVDHSIAELDGSAAGEIVCNLG